MNKPILWLLMLVIAILLIPFLFSVFDDPLEDLFAEGVPLHDMGGISHDPDSLVYINTRITDTNIPYINLARKTISETRASTTTLAADDDLRFNVGANEVWAMFVSLVSGGPGQADLKIAWSVPTGTSFMYWAPTSRDETSLTYLGSPGPADDELVIPLQGTATAISTSLHGFVSVGSTAGEIILMWAQNNSNSTPTSLIRNSHIIVHKLDG